MTSATERQLGKWIPQRGVKLVCDKAHLLQGIFAANRCPIGPSTRLRLEREHRTEGGGTAVARNHAADLRPRHALKSKFASIDLHVATQLLGQAHGIREADMRVVDITLGNHVVKERPCAFEHGAAEFLGRNELAALHLDAGLDLEQMGTQERHVGKTTAGLEKRQVGGGQSPAERDP